MVCCIVCVSSLLFFFIFLFLNSLNGRFGFNMHDQIYFDKLFISIFAYINRVVYIKNTVSTSTQLKYDIYMQHSAYDYKKLHNEPYKMQYTRCA